MLVIALILTGIALSFISPVLAMLALPGVVMTILSFVIYLFVLGFIALFTLKFVGVGVATLQKYPCYGGFALR
jgi:hypothetical protein